MPRTDRLAHKPKFNQKALRRRRLHFFTGLFVVFFLISSTFFIVQRNQQAQQIQLEKYPIQGVILNQADGFVDFQSLAQQNKLSFCYLNATSGATYFDDNFNVNVNRIEATDLKVGVIHYFSFDSSANAQFQYFKQKVKDNVGELPIAIYVQYYENDKRDVDWEKQGPKLAQLTVKLANYYNQPVIIKTTPKIYQILNQHYIKKSHFWLDKAPKSHQKQNIDFVQYDDKHRFKNGRNYISLPVSYYAHSKKQYQTEINKNS